MKKIVDLFKVKLSELPEDIGSAISNRIIYFSILSTAALVSAVVSKQIILVIGSVIIAFIMFGTLLHIFYLINKDKILYVNGICTELCENIVIKHSSVCYIMFTADGLIYKCTASPKLLKKVRVGMNVSVYAVESAVRKDDQGCVQIANPLFFFSSYPTPQK